jgi:3-oxoacyl-[acyl-carrier-protein] synthase II
MIFGFSRMRAVSTHYNDRPETASRPFDRGRDGFVLGEGAWMFVSSARIARWRAASALRRIEGYGSTCDAYHRVQMDPEARRSCAASNWRSSARIGGRRRSATSTTTAPRRS